VHAPVQKRWNVTGALRYSYYLDGSAVGPIDNEVRADGSEQNGMLGEVFALMAHPRRLRKGLERIE